MLWDAQGRLLRQLQSEIARSNDLALSSDCSTLVMPLEDTIIWVHEIKYSHGGIDGI